METGHGEIFGHRQPKGPATRKASLHYRATSRLYRPNRLAVRRELEDWKAVVVPLLALPQITHYILDGFIWRRRSNPELRSVLNGKGDRGPYGNRIQ